MSLWIARDGCDSLIYPEHVLNYLLEKSTSRASETCFGDAYKQEKDAGNKELEGGCLLFI